MRNPASGNLMSKNNSPTATNNPEYFRAVVETANESIIAINNRGLITFWNKGAETIFGYTPAETIGRPVTMIMPARFREQHKTGLERMAAEEGSHIIGKMLDLIGLKKDGREFPLELSLSAWRTGDKTFFTGIARDITKRKQARKALQESELNYKRLFETMVEGFAHHQIVLDDQGKPIDYTFLSINPAFEKLTGLKAADILGKTVTEALPGIENDPADWIGVYGKVALGGDPLHFEQYAETLKRWYSVFVYRPAPLQFVTLFHDVTERKQAEASLREGRDRFRNVVTSVSDHIYVTAINPDGSKTNLYFSPNVEELTGYPPEKFLADWNFWSSTVIHPDDRAAAAVQAEKLAGGQSSAMEYRIIRADGRMIWVRDSGRVVNQPDGRRLVYGVIGDVTRRKQAEIELRRRNRELKMRNQITAAAATLAEPEALLEIACRELALACKIPRATAFMLNKRGTRVTVAAEYNIKEQPSVTGAAFIVKNNEVFQNLLARKTSLSIADAPNDPRLASLREIIRRRGTASLLIVPIVVQEEVIGSLNLESNEPRSFSTEDLGLAWRASDQTALALSRLRLNEERRLLNTIIEQTAESVVITDTKGNIIYVNPAFEQITGYSRTEAMGQTPRILKSGQHDVPFYRKLWNTITAGQVWRGRFINQKKNGELYTEEATISPVRNDNGDITHYVAVKRDVTHELRLEEQFHQAQKMESIGRLAGGVAHDFNNILTAIIGYSEMLLAHFPNPADPRREEVEQIKKAGQQAARLTRQLLTFSRRRPFEPQTLNLNEIVANLEKMLARVIGDDIALITHLAPDLGRVKADPGQMEQVLMNLAVNARDAMPQGGKLIIETANIDLDSDYTGWHLGVRPGSYVQLRVSDTGQGMDAKTRAHIFEPFFTTKKMGQGTGLGLSTVHGIVQQSGGHIRVYSEPGQGATFKIYLPRTTDPVTPPSANQAAPDSLTGAETILLVEDNPGVRLVMRKFLQKHGYTLLEANRAEAVLQQYRQYEGQIDLLITDVIMPGMSGPELAALLIQLQPGLKVIYTSGYTDNQLDQYKIAVQNAAFLEKPFSLNALLRMVRQVLDTG